MILAADAPHASRPAPKILAGALALGVHALFVLLLVFGVSWQTHRPEAVMVDLWQALPETPPPPARPRPPQPVKAAVKTPEPAKPAPLPKPVEKEPPPPKAPDIALEKKKAEADRLKKLQAEQAAEEKARVEEKARAEAARVARDKQVAEQKRQALLRQMEAEELKQQLAADTAANEARLARLTQARAASKRQAEVASVVGQYRDQISAKVRGNTRLPDNLKGNPQVRCLVKLLPTGEVLSVRVTQSSGNPAYDDAVVRAIEKSSPLPLPSDRDARAAFVPELSFVHRPKE
ncbi:MAG: cell envelope integrity protein TolA [Hydrogenophilales bacterium]|nr:cell envelope integrity protein TolA [Hydrogenophilales bacterium]